MKKATLLLAGAILAFSANDTRAQATKRVLFEHFTGTWCGPCAQKNPNLWAIYNNNPATVRIVSFHLASSIGGTNDPFYHGSSGDEEKEFGFYGFNGTPYIMMMGNKKSGDPTKFSSSDVTSQVSKSTPIGIAVSQVDNGATRDITVTVSYHGTPPAGTHSVRVAVVKDEIAYTGSNGEKTHHWVFRDMPSGWNGSAITLQSSGSETFKYTHTEESKYLDGEIQVIAWVQNTSTKEVLNVGSTLDLGSDVEMIADEKMFIGQNYPNPADQSTYIALNKIEKDAVLEVVDMVGKVMISKNISRGTEYIELNTSSLTPGIYMYRLMDNGRSLSAVKKLQVVH